MAALMETAAGPVDRSERFRTSLFAKASPEFQFVAACCRWPGEKAQPVLDGLLQGQLNWPRLLRLAERHRVTGMVAEAIRERADIPADAVTKLKGRTAQIQRENLAHIGTALRVGRALTGEEIQFLVLKGAPLSQLAFGTTSMRHMRDIDLLVREEDARATVRILFSLGFKEDADQEGMSARQAEAWIRFRKHRGFTHPATRVELELHWRAFDNARLGEVSLAEPQWVEVSPGQRLPTLPLQEMLLLLCVHGAGHAWFRLKWISDVAALLGHLPEGSWDKLLRLARERDLDRPVMQARLLCAALFDDVAAAAGAGKADAVDRWLARVGRDALLTEVTRSKSAEADFVPRKLTASRFLLRRNWQYRLEEARVNAASPADWNALPMPDALHFMYPLLRVPLWVRRRWFSGRNKQR